MPDPTTLPVRVVTGEFYRQTAPKLHPLKLPEKAPHGGRYHRKGDEPPLYTSTARDSAWAELFRHTEPPISPFEVKRRMTKLQVTALPVLDLTNADVRARLGVSIKNLQSNRYADCRRISDAARRSGDRFGGILAPSAADPQGVILIVFKRWIPATVRILSTRTGTPPMRLFGLYERVIDSLPPGLQDEARSLSAQLRYQLRKRGLT